MMKMDRRSFIRATGAAVLVAGTMAKGKVWGANDRIRVGSIGLNGRGWDLARNANARDDAEVVALCDVDSNVLNKRAAEIASQNGAEPKKYKDIRDLVADEGIDAVTIGVPNHWHVLAAIWAMEHGKHVYVEKPISHTVFEGRQLVAAQAKYNRVLQHGTQRRSDPYWRHVAERARSGIIGDIYMIRCGIDRLRDQFNNPMEEPVPEWLDWTLWQGPAPDKPFSRNYVHYNWHWFWHYGNGEIGNNGPHATDFANWIYDKGLPVETCCGGGIFGYTDDVRETPNTQMVTHTFADGTLMVIDVRNRFTDSYPWVSAYGSEGHMVGGKFYDKENKEIPDEPMEPVGDSSQLHMENFIEAVKAEDPGAINATAKQGHVAAALCHLGNVAYLARRTIRFDPETETCPGDDEANALLTRTYREGFEVLKLA